MTLHTAIDIPVKPRVLIADDSRIVRATLIKHIEGMFEFREALNGEEAWETLLLDPHIRMVITDLTMPKLDGYGLLRRIRSSKVRRIREIPVVVVSGSDEREERDRAKAAGATDLITKGIGTAQLLSRLDILSRIANTQHEYERGLETLAQHAPIDPFLNDSPNTDALCAQAETLLANAVKVQKNFVILNICVGLKHAGLDDDAETPPPAAVDAIGELLQRTVRHTDLVAKTGEAEFTLATDNLDLDSTCYFAQRICRAIASAHLIKADRMSFIVSCGLVSLGDDDIDADSITLAEMRTQAHRRAILGLNRAITGVIGIQEDRAFQRGEKGVALADASCSEPPDLATLLQWVKEGRENEVLPHIGKLAAELQPLVDLLLQQNKR